MTKMGQKGSPDTGTPFGPERQIQGRQNTSLIVLETAKTGEMAKSTECVYGWDGLFGIAWPLQSLKPKIA